MRSNLPLPRRFEDKLKNTDVCGFNPTDIMTTSRLSWARRLFFLLHLFFDRKIFQALFFSGSARSLNTKNEERQKTGILFFVIFQIFSPKHRPLYRLFFYLII